MKFKIFNPLIIFLLLIIEKSSVVCAQTLTDSLIAYYPFDGNAIDVTGNGNDGTIFGVTLVNDRFGNASSAYNFNGVNNRIEYNPGSKFKPTTFPISISMWIKSNNTAAIGPLFKNDFPIDIYTGVSLQVDNGLGGTLEVHYGDGGTTGSCCRRSKFGTTPVNDNQWHFIAAIIRGPTNMDIWVDCDYDGGTYGGSGGGMVYSNNDGASGVYDVVVGTFYYKGVIDDLRYYHRELFQADLLTLYNTPFAYDSIAVSLGNDTSLCSTPTVTLYPTITFGSATNYLWSTGSTNQNLTVNTPGTYIVTAFSNCAVAVDTIVVSAGNAFLNNPVQTVCNGNSISLNAPIGSSYSWSPSLGLSCTNCQSPIASPTVNSTYISLINSGNCLITDTFLVNVQNLPALTAGNNSIMCTGQTASLNCSNGFTAYSWSPNSGLSCSTCQTTNASPVSSTTYTVTGTLNNCSTTSSVVVTVNSVNTIPTIIDTICPGGNILINAALNNSSYSWFPSTGLICSTCQVTDASPLSTTTYLVDMTNNGCTATDTFIINVITPPLFSAGNDLTICLDSSIQLSATSGYTNYQWSPSFGLNCSNCVNPIANPNQSTSYVVSADFFSCSYSDTVIINVLSLSFSLSLDTIICLDDSVQLYAPPGFVSYHWAPNSGLSCNNCLNPYASPYLNTTYTLTIYDGTCYASNTVAIDLLVPTIDAGLSQTIYEGQSVTLEATGSVNYQWSPSLSLNNSTVFSPTAFPSSTTVYTVTGINDYGCLVSDTITVFVLNPCDFILFPNAFSPNTDGVNDFFKPINPVPQQFKSLRIYNRWGELIFETTLDSDYWDGKRDGVNCQLGVYVFYAIYSCHGEEKIMKGNLTLIR